jgi:hypothetical protein
VFLSYPPLSFLIVFLFLFPPFPLSLLCSFSSFLIPLSLSLSLSLQEVGAVQTKQERIQASLKEREREVQMSRSAQEKEWDRERDQFRKMEAQQTLKALLVDMVGAYSALLGPDNLLSVEGPGCNAPSTDGRYGGWYIPSVDITIAIQMRSP